MSSKRKQAESKKEIDLGKKEIGMLKHSNLIILTFLLITYFQVVKFDFVYLDDDLIILDNFDKLTSKNSIVTAFTTQYGFNQGTPYYRPITMLSFVINAQIFGKNPAWYHVTNLILHFIVSVLLFKLLELFKIRKLLALLISIIFVVHPLVTNAVIWIVGRNDLIACIFTLLSFIYSIKYVKENNSHFIFLHSCFYLFAILSKEVSFPLPLIVLSYLLLFTKNKLKGKFLLNLLVAWVIPVILFLILRYNFTQQLKNVAYGIGALIQNVNSIPDIISKIFFPINLAVLPTISSMRIIAGLIISIALIVLPFFIKKIQKREYYFGLLWFFIFTVPGLLVLYSNRDERFEYLDTRAYLPLIGIMVIVTEVLRTKEFDLNKKANLIKSLAVILILAALTFFQSKKYQDAITFAESAVESNPDKAFFYQKLGDYYFTKGDYIQAAKYLEKTVEKAPNNFFHYKNLSLAYYYLGNNEKTLLALEKAYELNSTDFEILLALIKMNYNLKRFKESFFFANKVIELGGSVDEKLYNDLKALQIDK